MDREIIKIGTFAASFGTLDFGSGGFVILVEMVTEAFGGGSYNFALESFGIVPSAVKFLIAIHS